jgi:hypothetical protein
LSNFHFDLSDLGKINLSQEEVLGLSGEVQNDLGVVRTSPQNPAMHNNEDI